MSQQPETKPGSSENLTPPQDRLTIKQIEKIDLELSSLRLKIKRIERYSPIFPLVGFFITLLALWIGFRQFQSQQSSLQEKTLTEQRYARANRLQDQLRSDVDTILRFSHDDRQTISIVSFLLKDMRLLMKEGTEIGGEIQDKELAQEFEDSERRVTEALKEQVVNDADFEKRPRDISFASKVVTDWPDYRIYLREPERYNDLRRMIVKYIKAMSNFREKNASYLDNVSYNPVSKLYALPRGYDSTLFQSLSDILVGFKDHFDLMSGDPAEKELFRSRFLKALHNQSLAATIFKDGVNSQPPDKKRKKR